ncbi:translation initiation factor IF-2 [Capnocytophaga haemolytica]|uniref:Translation initiation factor IF-2 n=1 Tax=Capnocytophaga haemolytica TaxID=45243 RepID=A0AAX2H215_9FLAO|nr:translation initiation factor IF-2 [Capnocytophaga haemolytica]AMD85839.1 translation initiation factor IF-2 [Capnocytophaga haemolytica]SFN80734.1 translation initiation factor IF-2 [Capnocytophaga haemolytica]SNV15642.1 Translation initiation factor IF-2 [Capnocytophaga haemolytica]
MSEGITTRLSKVLKELNISLETAVDYLKKEKGVEIESNPNTKVSEEVVNLLSNKFNADKSKREVSKEIVEDQRKAREAIRLEQERENAEKRKQQEQEVIKAKAQLAGLKQVGKIDLDEKKDEKANEPVNQKKDTAPKTQLNTQTSLTKEDKSKKEKKKGNKDDNSSQAPIDQPITQKKKEEKSKQEIKDTPEVGVIETQYQKLTGPKLVGEKIDLSQFEKKKKKKKKNRSKDKEDTQGTQASEGGEKRKRKRIIKDSDQRSASGSQKGDKKAKIFTKIEPTEEEVQKQVRETLEKLQGKTTKSKGAKYRKEKRDTHRQRMEDEIAQQEQEQSTLKVTEFVTVSELATMMDVPVNKVIGACMTLGIMVTMNQRLDAETLTIVADEFGFDVEFATANIEEAIHIEEDAPEDLVPRAPIVTVMGHVDHGKTSLLDYIRKENVIAGESGGITQHIGAYSVKLENGERITFLDTPGHEAFTAMRARGTKITDIAIIMVAADDDVMPQTKEAISHAQAAGVPIIFAINKIDKPNANPDKIKEQLANMNLLVEEWGGKIQSQDISAKKGIGVPELLEKVLLEAEILELKANPNKPAIGTVVEASLDKGRGYVSTVLVEGGTLHIGDYVLAGTCSGKIRAMHDERGKKVTAAGPSTPISILGLDGAPQAGDKFYVFEDEKEAKQIVAKRAQLQREQSVRTQRHITLDEIGRRIALGDFKQLNIILKGDVDGSVEALTDSFQKLSTEEIQVSIIHKGVGAITESDVLLASASDAIIIGFNVRPMTSARALAEKESIDIRTYSIIYDAINDLKDAMEGMLSPEFKEEVTGTVEIRELFKISKVGTIAGCMVTDGKIYRTSKIRLLRDNVVIYTGELSSLKRFKDDVKEVSKGYDCGLQIKNYNDIHEGDVLEAYQEVAVKKKL